MSGCSATLNSRRIRWLPPIWQPTQESCSAMISTLLLPGTSTAYPSCLCLLCGQFWLFSLSQEVLNVIYAAAPALPSSTAQPPTFHAVEEAFGCLPFGDHPKSLQHGRSSYCSAWGRPQPVLLAAVCCAANSSNWSPPLQLSPYGQIIW